MALKASKEAQKTVKQAKVPNKRERAASQFGQLDPTDANFATYWATSSPKTILEALQRLAKAVSNNGASPIA